MSTAFNRVMAGLEDAHAYLNGERDGFGMHDIEVPEPDVCSIRGKTGLSQPAFARTIGVPLGTLKSTRSVVGGCILANRRVDADWHRYHQTNHHCRDTKLNGHWQSIYYLLLHRLPAAK